MKDSRSLCEDEIQKPSKRKVNPVIAVEYRQSLYPKLDSKTTTLCSSTALCHSQGRLVIMWLSLGTEVGVYFFPLMSLQRVLLCKCGWMEAGFGSVMRSSAFFD